MSDVDSMCSSPPSLSDNEEEIDTVEARPNVGAIVDVEAVLCVPVSGIFGVPLNACINLFPQRGAIKHRVLLLPWVGLNAPPPPPSV